MIESNEEKENSESFSTVKVLIVYYSRYGNTSRMAEEIDLWCKRDI